MHRPGNLGWLCQVGLLLKLPSKYNKSSLWFDLTVLAFFHVLRYIYLVGQCSQFVSLSSSKVRLVEYCGSSLRKGCLRVLVDGSFFKSKLQFHFLPTNVKSFQNETRGTFLYKYCSQCSLRLNSGLKLAAEVKRFLVRTLTTSIWIDS